jgi:hypothetical protein
LVKTGNNKAKPDPKARASNIQLSVKKFTGQTFIHQKNAALSADAEVAILKCRA